MAKRAAVCSSLWRRTSTPSSRQGRSAASWPVPVEEHSILLPEYQWSIRYRYCGPLTGKPMNQGRGRDILRR
eukprot:2910971-Rhodomonas_salina.1